MAFFPHHSFQFYGLWLLVVLYFVPLLLVVLLRKGVFHKTSSVFSSSRSRMEYRFFLFSKFFMLAYVLYSFAIPLQPASSLFWAGFSLYTAGFLLYVISWIQIAASDKNTVFTGGIYRYSRHPVYISSAAVFIGAGLASLSWFYLILSCMVAGTHLSNALAEERICEEVYGEAYREYKRRTPRWLGRPSVKQ